MSETSATKFQEFKLSMTFQQQTLCYQEEVKVKGKVVPVLFN
jgi:hypothetical protein